MTRITARSKQLSVQSNQENAIKELKNAVFEEFQQVRKHVHNFINDLTAISGYAQLAKLQPERSAAEAQNIIHTVEKSMHVLRCCVASLQEFERKYSQREGVHPR